MSNFYINISGCLKYSDYSEVTNWLSRASVQLCPVEYDSLIIRLNKSFPSLFKRDDTSKYKANIKSLDERKKDIEKALKDADYKQAKKLYSTYFTFNSYPEFFGLLDRYQKQNFIESFSSSVKKNLSTLEQELRLDFFTHIEYPDSPFFRRVQTEKANFYFTRNSGDDLSIIRGKQRGFARHLSWDHPFSREILSTELGESGSYGLVSLIGDFTPKENDLTNVSYFTSSGRDYFSSALDTLTDNNAARSQKIDVDNFMRMKEVIPTASQMKAIYAKGNYIIDGPAGTGKSTSLLQKLLILTSQQSIRNDKVLILVKHDGLVEPFKKLLMDMRIQGIQIDSVANFLYSKFGKQFDQVSLARLDEAEKTSDKLTYSLNTILNMHEPTEYNIDLLPSKLVNISLVRPVFRYYCQLVRDIKKTNYIKSERLSKVIKVVDDAFGFEKKILDRFHIENSLVRKFHYLKGKKFDSYDREIIDRLSSEHKGLIKVLDNSGMVKNLLYKPILNSIEKEFISLEKRVNLHNSWGNRVSLGDYIQSEIQVELKKYEESLTSELINERRSALKNDIELIGLDKQRSNLDELVKSTAQELRSLIWGKALIVESDLDKKLIDLHANIILEKDNYQIIIIDEAQDVPSNNIELAGFYSKQLVLSGDEAQKENKNGLGEWSNLRSKMGFHSNGILSIFKLRHNFRQTYELGSLSYNYRQLLLGNTIEDLEADYFENQKGFNIPSIVNMNTLNELVKDKLKYISECFVQKFPLVIISSDLRSQNKIKNELAAQGINVASGGTSNNMDVLVLVANKVSGREFPVVISMLSNTMEDSTVYIILSRAKFDLTLVVPFDYHIDANLSRLMDFKMLTD